MFDPAPHRDDMVYQYRQSHPIPPHIISSFLHGVPKRSPGHFIDIFLQRPISLRLKQLTAVYSLLLTMSRVAQVGSDLDTSLMKTICRSQQMFTYLFSLLHDPRQLSLALGSDSVTAVKGVLHLTRHLLNLVDGRWADQAASFLRVCGRSRLFEGLEGILRYGRYELYNLCTYPSDSTL